MRAAGEGERERGRAWGEERERKKMWAATCTNSTGPFKKISDLQNCSTKFVNSKNYPNIQKLFALKPLLIVHLDNKNLKNFQINPCENDHFTL